MKYLTVILIFLMFGCKRLPEKSFIVGSKKFTESVILGEIIKTLAENEGVNSLHKAQLGGTRVLWNALVKGEIDAYPEYTGTIIKEIFSGENAEENNLHLLLARNKILISHPLGFNNTYALGMKRAAAETMNIELISDLRKYPELKFGFTNEFMDRADGWKGLKKKYSLPQKNARGIDHDLAYRGLEGGSIDVIDLYSTDAEIDYYNLKVMKDDLEYFTRYDAVILFREDLKSRFPRVYGALGNLEGKISAGEITALNKNVKIDGMSETSAAIHFLKNKFGIDMKSHEEGFAERLLTNTSDHLSLVLISMLAAIFISIPLGILSFYYPKAGELILGMSGIIQTIPSLALLVFMIPFFGIGAVPAIIALFLYSLLPIVRNTYLGFKEIADEIRESAEALGLSRRSILTKIEFPLAAPSILAGIKTSTVINIGTATLGALIGAGGYGQPILTGIRLDNIPLILEGAIPAAAMAILAQLLFDFVEKKLFKD